MERRVRATGRLAALGMTPAHHGGVEALFQNFSAARFEHGFAAQNRRAMRLFVEVGLQPVRLFGRQETGLGLRMPELQAGRSGEQVLDRKAPFTGKSFDPLSRHPIYTIRPLTFYPVGVLLPPPSGAAQDVLFSAGAREIPS